MTIDEAIEHAEDVATKKRMQATDYYDGRIWDNNIRKCEKCANEHKELAEWLEQLKEYRQLEEHGRLIKLPCKVGDTIYIIAPKYCDCTDECDLYNERFRRYLKWCKKYCPNGFKGIGVLETVIQRIEIRGNDTYVMTGKDGLRDLDNIFLTKSEAEAKLKELRGGENE